MIVDSYKNAFNYIMENDHSVKFEWEVANNCDVANEKIDGMYLKKSIDLVFLDIKIPPSLDRKFISGEDLGAKIKELMPSTRIIVSTTFNDNFRINNILVNLNPDGFLIKDDISPEDLILAIRTVLIKPPFYSSSVLGFLRKQATNEIVLDRIDRRLLYELSIGTKMNEMPNILYLSMPALEKRKRRLKEVFDTEKKNDRDLILAAKTKGFI